MSEPVAQASAMSWISTTLNRPAEQIAPVVLGMMLIAAGIVLMIEKMRVDGSNLLWPLLLLFAGAARIGAAPSEGTDEAWWLVSAGSWLLLKALAPTLFHQMVAFAVMAAGVVAWRKW